MKKGIQSRKGRFLGWNPWNHDAEPGDKMIDCKGQLFRLETSSNWSARTAGELYPRLVRPPKEGMKAVLIDGVAYWEWEK